MVTIGAIALLLGFRPDLDLAMQGPNFWIKWAYTISLGLLSIHATARLARPDQGRLSAPWLMLLPLAALAGVGAVELMRAPPADWLAMWLGHSWRVCSAMRPARRAARRGWRRAHGARLSIAFIVPKYRPSSS